MESIFTCYTSGCPVTYILFGHDIEKLGTILSSPIKCHFCGEELGYVDHSAHGWIDTRKQRAKEEKKPASLPGKEWKKAQGAFDFLKIENTPKTKGARREKD